MEEREIEAIVLETADGEEMDFEVVSDIEYNGVEYVVLYPLYEDSDEYTILRVVRDEKDEVVNYCGIDSNEELMAVYKKFCDEYEED